MEHVDDSTTTGALEVLESGVGAIFAGEDCGLFIGDEETTTTAGKLMLEGQQLAMPSTQSLPLFAGNATVKKEAVQDQDQDKHYNILKASGPEPSGGMLHTYQTSSPTTHGRLDLDTDGPRRNPNYSNLIHSMEKNMNRQLKKAQRAHERKIKQRAKRAAKANLDALLAANNAQASSPSFSSSGPQRRGDFPWNSAAHTAEIVNANANAAVAVVGPGFHVTSHTAAAASKQGYAPDTEVASKVPSIPAGNGGCTYRNFHTPENPPLLQPSFVPGTGGGFTYGNFSAPENHTPPHPLVPGIDGGFTYGHFSMPKNPQLLQPSAPGVGGGFTYGNFSTPENHMLLQPSSVPGVGGGFTYGNLSTSEHHPILLQTSVPGVAGGFTYGHLSTPQNVPLPMPPVPGANGASTYGHFSTPQNALPSPPPPPPPTSIPPAPAATAIVVTNISAPSAVERTSVHSSSAANIIDAPDMYDEYADDAARLDRYCAEHGLSMQCTVVPRASGDRFFAFVEVNGVGFPAGPEDHRRGVSEGLARAIAYRRLTGPMYKCELRGK